MAEILRLDFEEGDKTDFDSEEASGQMTATVGAALVGSYGLAGVHDGAGLDFGGINAITVSGNIIRFRFYMDANTLSMTDGDATYVFLIKTDGTLGGVTDLLRVRFQATSGTVNIDVLAGNDDDTDEVTSSVAMPTSAPFFVEVLLERATTNVAADGEVTLWVDDTIVGSTVTSIDNYDLWPTIVDTFFGGDSSDAGTSGTIYLDDLIINDDGGYIGPDAAESASVSPSSSASPSVSPSSSDSPSVSPSGSVSPSASPSPGVTGEVTWGHDTGVIEVNVLDFTGRWTGTGAISGAGDAETIDLASGEYMESDIVNTGVDTANLYQNLYDVSGNDVLLRYRHGATPNACAVAAWSNYTVPFASSGYVQVRLESTL